MSEAEFEDEGDPGFDAMEDFLHWLDAQDDDEIIEVDVEYDDLEGYDEYD